MKSTKTCLRKSIEVSDELLIEKMGEFLINRSITETQINEGLNIQQGRMVIDALLKSDFIEEVPNSNPVAYQIKDKLDQWMLDCGVFN